MLAWADTAGRRLLDLDGGDERIAELREARGRLDGELGTLAGPLTAGRARRCRAARPAWSPRSCPAWRWAVPSCGSASSPRDEPGPHGADRVEMLLVPHAGAPARPLGKGASGGELSRVMLAIEVALATRRPGATRPGTFVFDEVDAGVGGRAAIEVGRRLSALAQGSQVLVVTHLAQVAAFADRHLVVTKSTADGVDVVTESDVRLVTRDERVRELARMLSGQEDSDAARTHAAELLELSSVGR